MAETGPRLRLRRSTPQSASLSGNGPGHDGLRRESGVAVDMPRADLTDPCDVGQVEAQFTDTDVDYGGTAPFAPRQGRILDSFPQRRVGSRAGG